MSGTQTLVEVVLTLPESKREAWRALPAAGALKELADLPADHGRLELTENKKSVTARAFFCVEADHWADRLIDAFRAAAALGASGKGVSFLLVDYQREEGHALTIAEGTSSLEKLPAGKARAKHAALDALLERCVTPAPEPLPPGDPLLERACQDALAKLRMLPPAELDAAWQHVKSTTMTSAAFGATKKQEKQLLALVDNPPAHWEWAKALPLRLLFPREPEATEMVVLGLLDGATLKQQEHWMLFESLADSSSAAALDRLRAGLAGEWLFANVARRALAASIHPQATAAIVELAQAWLDRSLASPQTLAPTSHVIVIGAPPDEATGVLGLLELRSDATCEAMLFTIWQRLFAIRAELSAAAATVAVKAAATYVSSAARALEPALALPLRQRFPHMQIPLEKAAEAVDELHKLAPPPMLSP